VVPAFALLSDTEGIPAQIDQHGRRICYSPLRQGGRHGFRRHRAGLAPLGVTGAHLRRIFLPPTFAAARWTSAVAVTPCSRRSSCYWSPSAAAQGSTLISGRSGIRHRRPSTSRWRREKIRDEPGNHLGELAMSFRVSFPAGSAGDAARAVLTDAVRKSHDRLCTVSQTVELASPIGVQIQG